MNRRKFLSTLTGVASLIGAGSLPVISGCQESVVSNSKPLSPINVKASGRLDSVLLTWGISETAFPNRDAEGKGKFRIYRTAIPSSPYVFLAEVDFSQRSYTDANLKKGEPAFYKVSVIDENGNESDLSRESNEARLSIQVEPNELPTLSMAIYFNYDGIRVNGELERSDVTLSRTALGFIAMSRFCTHAGCSNMVFQNQEWTCRCHGSKFSATGEVLASPAQTKLTRFKTELLANGSLVVNFTDAM
ncbi:MAG: Rieske 2Fe-2S domain-containing protein [Chloroherpetonaceae bacterium]|nr:Rieske 2Fe-2S domain-containing protein [Chloroherpetonaceae bacterium]